MTRRPRPRRPRPSWVKPAAAVAAALALIALAGCSSTTATAGDPTGAPTASPTIFMTVSPAPSTLLSTDSSPAAAKSKRVYPAGLATYPATPADSSAITVTTPCDSGTLTVAAHPEGKGVAMTATLENPAHTSGWVGRTGITPFANAQGDPYLPPHALTNGVLALTRTNLSGPDAISDPAVNHAWPQSAGVELVLSKSVTECDTNVYLSATHGAIDTTPLHINIQRHAGTIGVHDVPLAGRGPWMITVTATSANGAQRQARSVVASTEGVTGAPFTLATKFTGFTNLDDFTTLTITSAKTDGTHPTSVTLTRTP